MFQKKILLVWSICLLDLAGNALAINWSGGAGPGTPYWNLAANWDPYGVPTSGDNAMAIKVPGYGPTVANPGAVAASVYVGIWGCPGELTTTSSGNLSVASNLLIGNDSGNTGVVVNDGSINVGGTMSVGHGGTGEATNTGTISITGDIVIGFDAGNTGTLTTDGDIDVSGWMYVGLNGDGLLNMNGGEINITHNLFIAKESGSVGHVNLHDGTITTNWLGMEVGNSSATMEIIDGTLLISANQKNIIDDLVSTGQITASDSNAVVVSDWDITNPGYTTVWAHVPVCMHWDGGAGAGNPNWSTGLNWSLDSVPTSADDVQAIKVPGYGPTIANPGAAAKNLYVGAVGWDGELTVTSSGSINVGADMNVGISDGNGLLNINGGVINVTGNFDIATQSGATGHVNFHGGTVTAGGLCVNSDGTGTADFTEGILTAAGDHTAIINWMASAGVMYWTAYGGSGSLVVRYYPSTDNTSVTATLRPVGDLSGDCVVNVEDLWVFAEQWLDPGGCSGIDCADLDSVNGVNLSDFAFLANNWLVDNSSFGEKSNEVWMTYLEPWPLAYSNQWQLVKHNLGALEFYIDYVNSASQTDVTNLVNVLKQYGIKIAVECGGLVDWNADAGNRSGELSFSDEYNKITKILNAGGTIDYLNMDGPIRRMLYPGDVEQSYHTVDSACDELVDVMQLWRQYLPNIKLCVLTNFPNWGWKGGPAYNNLGHSPGSMGLGDYYEVIQKIIQKANAAGIPINSVTVDNPYDYAMGTHGSNQPGVIAGVDWMERIYDLEKYVESQNIEFNLIFNSEIGGNTSNQLFHDESLDFITEYHAIGGTPLRYIMQSWYYYPDALLPETTNYTMTNLTADSFYQALPIVKSIGSPVGEFESCASAQAKGWAMDHDDLGTALQIHFYKDGPAGDGTLVGGVTANEYRSDVGNHGFTWNIPADCQGHRLYAHPINIGQGANFLLSGSPRTWW